MRLSHRPFKIINSIVKGELNVNNFETITARERPVIAIVDDDPAVRNSLKFSLELEGFAVRTFGSGTDLLCSEDLEACSCFVIDQRMPVINGMDVIAKLRGRKVFTPAILIISHPNDAVSARATRSGVSIVEKPLFGNVLVDRIREVCRIG
jgi:FixJ family two-component response regulator